MSPKVSVLMPNYNCERYITEAIESILNQSFTDFEFIIIDDASIDRSWQIIQEYTKRDKRIVVMRNEENMKICKTLNKGIEIAKWEYIARMDSDDIANDDWLQKVFERISSDKTLWLCWANFNFINSLGEKTWEKKFPQTDKECRDAIWFRNPFAHNTVIIPKRVLEEVWWYDDDFVYAEDLELWIRIWAKYKFFNIQENLVQYRISWENSILKKQRLMIQNTLKARRKALKLWYKIWLKGYIFYLGTWCMKFFPPKIVLWIFNNLT